MIFLRIIVNDAGVQCLIAEVDNVRFYLILKIEISYHELGIHTIFCLQILERIFIHSVGSRTDDFR